MFLTKDLVNPSPVTETLLTCSSRVGGRDTSTLWVQGTPKRTVLTSDAICTIRPLACVVVCKGVTRYHLFEKTKWTPPNLYVVSARWCELLSRLGLGAVQTDNPNVRVELGFELRRIWNIDFQSAEGTCVGSRCKHLFLHRWVLSSPLPRCC